MRFLSGVCLFLRTGFPFRNPSFDFVRRFKFTIADLKLLFFSRSERRPIHQTRLPTPTQQLPSLLLVSLLPAQRARQHLVSPTARLRLSAVSARCGLLDASQRRLQSSRERCCGFPAVSCVHGGLSVPLSTLSLHQCAFGRGLTLLSQARLSYVSSVFGFPSLGSISRLEI